jgi:hypothetical protein
MVVFEAEASLAEASLTTDQILSLRETCGALTIYQVQRSNFEYIDGTGGASDWWYFSWRGPKDGGRDEQTGGRWRASDKDPNQEEPSAVGARAPLVKDATKSGGSTSARRSLTGVNCVPDFVASLSAPTRQVDHSVRRVSLEPGLLL